MRRRNAVNRLLKMFLLSALLAIAPVALTAQGPESVEALPNAHEWLTTPDRANLLKLQPEELQFSQADGSLPAIQVNDMARFQPIDGFGVALTGGSAELLMKMDSAQREQLLRELFTRKGDGIGISYLRVSIGSSDMNDHAFTYNDMPAGETDVDLKHFSLGPDRTTVIPVLKEILAMDPGIKIFGSPWSAPAWMKTNDRLKGGHLKPEYYGVYARYFVRYLETMKRYGITLHAVTIQNEPLNPKNTPSMVMFAPEEAAFIAKYLGPALAKAGLDTKIWLYDHNPDVPSYPLSILADPAASKYAEGTAFHLYGGAAATFSRVHEAYPNKKLFMTEQSVTQGPGNGPMDVDEPVQQVLIASTRNWSRNVLLWNLAADPEAGPHTNDGGCTGCYGAITLDGNHVMRNVAYYALAHFSKFVPPGSVRIASNELEQLATVAFATPDGKIVLVVANTGNFAKKFEVKYHGEVFTTTVPEESVATYVW
jgi:glucosylceramidase